MSSLDFFKQVLSIDPKATSTAVTPFSYLIESKTVKIHFVRIEHFEESSFKMASRILSTNHPEIIVVFEKEYNSDPELIISQVFGS